MKEYETLTREKVDVVPFGCGMPETHLMQDWSDRMLDLILNGPTINGIKKDEVRAMLRETYTALKQYEKIGPMASPFINDPTAIVARAFSELYPGVEYVAQYVPDLRDETNGTAYGLTIFPDDGSTPIVCISAEAPISAAPELLAHELAHVATPEDTEHGESWSAASEAIFKKYNELLGTMIPDEPEPILSPHQPGDGGILTMPLRDNVPEPPTDDWQPTTCPVCGAECWQTDTARRILALEPDVRTACTACALKGLGKYHWRSYKNNERNRATAGGIGLCGLLAVAFIVLKLTGVINWSWLWVLAPIWIPTAITLAIIVIVLVAILVRELTKGGRP